MQDLAIEYVKQIEETKEYKELIRLKKLIDDKYKLEIIGFKTAESKYLEAKEYGKYYPNLKELQEEFSNKKKDLYSKPEVREYLSLERKINEIINNDLNEIKDSLLNPKYNKNKCIKG